jgi:hypothetical protein
LSDIAQRFTRAMSGNIIHAEIAKLEVDHFDGKSL